MSEAEVPPWAKALAQEFLVQSHSLFAHAAHGGYLDPDDYQRDLDMMVRHYARRIANPPAEEPQDERE